MAKKDVDEATQLLQEMQKDLLKKDQDMELVKRQNQSLKLQAENMKLAKDRFQNENQDKLRDVSKLERKYA